MHDSIDQGLNLPLWDEVKQKCHDNNILLIASIELTYQCNLSCGHCYLSDQRHKHENMLSHREICSVIDQLSDMGAMMIVLTGGEIFLREDLMDIISYSRRKGFIIDLLTNGTFITSAVADKLAEIGVSEVEVSLYGAEPLTHDSFTQVPGSFDKTLDALGFLIERGIGVLIKMIVMNFNFPELERVRALAAKMRARFTASWILTPTLGGSIEPKRFMLTPNQKEELYSLCKKLGLLGLAENGSVDRDHFADGHIKQELHLAYFLCNAGRSFCNISPIGDVSPCLMLPIIAGNIRQNLLQEIWMNEIFREFRDISFSDLTECSKCDLALECRRCPGFALHDGGNLLGVSPQICEIAKWRKEIKKGGMSIEG
jgi:radical SAM protein with 4Fe4S-binding SPASM domain